MNSSSLYILVNHGSRENSALKGLDRLIEQINHELYTQGFLIDHVSLEFSEIPLAQAIEQIVLKRSDNSLGRVNILPLFLSSGVHLTQDIPAELAKVKIRLRKQVTIELLPHLGSFSAMPKLLEQIFVENSSNLAKRILLVHGSRLSSANLESLALAKQLQSGVAFWSIEPGLDNIIERLMIAENISSIAILPYFLFDGGIIASVQTKVKEFALKYQDVDFHLTPTLGHNSELSSLIAQAIKTNEQNFQYFP